jgi:hypothetical protein
VGWPWCAYPFGVYVEVEVDVVDGVYVDVWTETEALAAAANECIPGGGANGG